ncbi:MAG: HEAT repeat domain-containing protein [Planctomycetota bacterium]|jgi:hypothetical protein
MSRGILVVPILLVLVSLPVGAQDVVRLKGGEIIAGKVTDGLLEVRVETPAGTVRVPWSEIEGIDRPDHVRSLFTKRAKEVKADDAAGHFLLAVWCRRHGLAKEMETELGKVLQIEPEHRAARAALGYEKVGEKWVAGTEILEAKGFVRRDDRWILEEEAAYEDMLKARKKALSEKEEKARDLILKAADENPRISKYALAALEGKSWDALRIPLFRALGHKKPEVRELAAAQLGRIGELEAVRPLLRSAVLDTKEPVREASVAALKSIGQPDAIYPLARALASNHPQIRMHAAAAIGGFGDIQGVEYLVQRLKMNWGPSGRVNIQVMNQVTYIRDFDVEIAQRAQIGDPIVGILREGVILDVQVFGVDRTVTTVERRVIYGALRNLTGQDLPEKPDAWAKWWGENKERLLAGN